MNSRPLLAFALLVVPAAAESIVIEVDKEVDSARYVLEGVLVEHLVDRSASRIEVGVDPMWIFRGFEAAGTSIEVGWPIYGPSSFQRDVPPGHRALFVVDRSGAIVVTGEPDGDGWNVRGFMDGNTAFVKIDDRHMKTRTMVDHQAVSTAWLDAQTGSDPRRDAVLLGRLLLEDVPAAEAKGRFDALVRDLDADDWTRRDAGERCLIGPLGLAFRKEIAALAASTVPPEQRDRLETIASALERWAKAEAFAASLRTPGPARWAVLAACLEGPDESLRAAAHATLVRETALDLPLDAGAWRTALSARR